MIREIIGGFVEGNYKMGFFAITNACNNRCKFCSIWKDKPKMVRFAEAKYVIDKLHKNKFNMLQLTGGEPLLNPDFFDIVGYAKSLGMVVFAPTNGTLINDVIADKLKRSGIDQISISLHHSKPEMFELTSGKKGILESVIKSIKILNGKKVPVSVLCTISRENIRDIENVVKLADKLNVAISFCLPMSATGTSFKLGGDSKSTDIGKDELKKVLGEIIRLKKKGHNVINSLEYLTDAIKQLEGSNKYPCMGGKSFVYVDWNLNAYPCMSKGKPVGIGKYDFGRPFNECNDCMIQCFREPSVFFGNRNDCLKAAIVEIPFMANLGIKRLRTLLR